MKEVTLLSHQVRHFDRILNIVNNNKAYLDTSQMGSGKTYITIKLAQTFKLKLLVVAPVSTLSMWNRTASEFGVEMVKTISYASLRGTKKGVNHIYLDRTDDQFRVTPTFKELVREGILLVFDEMHNLKNKKTAQIASAHALAIAIEGKSRIALLSATPCDKASHTESIFKMLGIINCNELYIYKRFEFGEGEYIFTGFKEVSNKCRQIDSKTANDILGHIGYEYPVTRVNVDSITSNLYTKIAKKIISSDMSQPDILIVKDVKNGFYMVEQEGRNNLKTAINSLKLAVGYNDDTKNVYTTNTGFGGITKALLGIEIAKTNLFIRLVTSTLTKNPQAKVILFMSYSSPISKSINMLAKYKPLLLDGKTSPKNRDLIMTQFQEPNTSHRLLISQIKVGGIGISLDDRHGNYPRYVFISPTYSFIDLYQATGRVYRVTTKSTVTIRMVYGQKDDVKDEELESSILNAMSRKTAIAKNMLFNSQSERMPFPGDYQQYIEPCH